MSNPPLDLVAALASTADDEGLLAELARLFTHEGPRRLTELKEALDTADAARVERVAHRLKGSLAAFGAEPARRLATELETLGYERRLDEALTVVIALEHEVARITAFFAAQGWIEV
jgi:HPt (histidine-containing phosphotransfer) domain-containing protein